MECIFCDIANKKTNTEIIFEDDDILAFNDIKPGAPLHLLIIPKRHITSMDQVSNDHQQLLGKLLLKAKDLAKQYGVNENGYRIVINTNSYGGQTVYHLHVHLLAKKQFSWPPG